MSTPNIVFTILASLGLLAISLKNLICDKSRKGRTIAILFLICAIIFPIVIFALN